MAGWFKSTRDAMWSVNGLTIGCLVIGGWLFLGDLWRDYLAAKRVAQRRALEEKMHLPKREWRVEELELYNGTDPLQPILIGVDGEVFNVWRGRDFYGAEGPYGVFAGKDATRYFAKQIVSLDEDDGLPLTSEELDNMRQWKDFLRMKYDAAGTLAS
ncbi:Probable steroid-binding protein 3 (AtMP3) (Membrane-associated progesterone-binding protein 2) (AtMAPR2) [Durusdinium trenchii]|uniref:Probable steroid-binding protein 3 (AtMP3) (Membrane-associated progesterone-binding protein 2) (AtMAPR2) n=1 Tax=Durusdinium trenchii TaxID=1381693 RepID=A0ABP0N811_9DINO